MYSVELRSCTRYNVEQHSHSGRMDDAQISILKRPMGRVFLEEDGEGGIKRHKIT